nr:hypothetical protein Iba_chr13cCG18160 [Ipomoea batatas]
MEWIYGMHRLRGPLAELLRGTRGELLKNGMLLSSMSIESKIKYRSCGVDDSSLTESMHTMAIAIPLQDGKYRPAPAACLFVFKGTPYFYIWHYSKGWPNR